MQHALHIDVRVLLSAEHRFLNGIHGSGHGQREWNGEKRLFERYRPLFGTIFLAFNGRRNKRIHEIKLSCVSDLLAACICTTTTTKNTYAASLSFHRSNTSSATAVSANRMVGLLTQSALKHKRSEKAARMCADFCIYFFLQTFYFAHTHQCINNHTHWCITWCYVCNDWVLSSVVWFWSHSWCIGFVLKGRKEERKKNTVCEWSLVKRIQCYIWYIIYMITVYTAYFCSQEHGAVVVWRTENWKFLFMRNAFASDSLLFENFEVLYYFAVGFES